MAVKPSFRARSSALAAIATAIGFLSLASASLADTGSVYVDASHNVGAGHDFFSPLFTANGNVGLAYSVMPNSTTGSRNVAVGNSALLSNTVGRDNVASGFQSLLSNTDGRENVATGHNALFDNTSGSENVATGHDALGSNTTGGSNVATGDGALNANSTGSANLAIGQNAGKNLTTGSNNVDIANAGKAGEAGTIRIGNDGKQTTTFIAGIGATTLSGAAQPVLVKANGQLGIAPGASAKSSAARPLSATAGKRLLATVKRQQRQNEHQAKEIRRQAKEIKSLRAQSG